VSTYVFWDVVTGRTTTLEADDEWRAWGIASALEDEWGSEAVDFDLFESRVREIEAER
jgi:hypothetical protein